MEKFTQFQGSANYIASPELSEAVNVALSLQRPLLIKGEPGTGKTRLAESVAEALDMPLLRWQVKSTSKAQEGLYVYDAVRRLNDSRFGGGDVSDIRAYIDLGPLGRAFESERRCVVLIDEVDKADLEFPNDLLHELDTMSFTVAETGDSHTAQHRPLVIITSNAEKELPDAFLRRCVFHYISFPSESEMRQILEVHHPQAEASLVQLCLEKFYWLRDQDEIRKRPSTSELIDWIAALQHAGVDLKALRSLPFLGVLLKSEKDQWAIQRKR